MASAGGPMKAVVVIPRGFFGTKTVGDMRERVTEREIFYKGGRPHISFYGRDIEIRRPDRYGDEKPVTTYWLAGTPISAKVSR